MTNQEQNFFRSCPPLDTPPLPDPGGRGRKRYASSIRVFQNGEKILEFLGRKMKIVSENPEKIIFYNVQDQLVTIYNKTGVVIVIEAEEDDDEEEN